MENSVQSAPLGIATRGIVATTLICSASFARESQPKVAYSPMRQVDKRDSATKYVQRFDNQAREDLFACFGGDKKLLKRRMDGCDEVLKENPKLSRLWEAKNERQKNAHSRNHQVFLRPNAHRHC